MTKRIVRRKPFPGPGEWYTPSMKAWLNGYVPVAADQQIAAGSAYKKGLLSRQAREKCAAAKVGWGAGTIEGIGKEPRPHDPRPIQLLRAPKVGGANTQKGDPA